MFNVIAIKSEWFLSGKAEISETDYHNEEWPIEISGHFTPTKFSKAILGASGRFHSAFKHDDDCNVIFLSPLSFRCGYPPLSSKIKEFRKQAAVGGYLKSVYTCQKTDGELCYLGCTLSNKGSDLVSYLSDTVDGENFYLREISDEEKDKLSLSAIKAVEKLHDEGIKHGDIKLENMTFDKYRMKFH